MYSWFWSWFWDPYRYWNPYMLESLKCLNISYIYCLRYFKLSLDCLQFLKQFKYYINSYYNILFRDNDEKMSSHPQCMYFSSIFDLLIGSWIFRIGIWGSTDVTENFITSRKIILVLIFEGLVTLLLLVIEVRVKYLLIFVLFFEEIKPHTELQK